MYVDVIHLNVWTCLLAWGLYRVNMRIISVSTVSRFTSQSLTNYLAAMTCTTSCSNMYISVSNIGGGRNEGEVTRPKPARFQSGRKHTVDGKKCYLRHKLRFFQSHISKRLYLIYFRFYIHLIENFLLMITVIWWKFAQITELSKWNSICWPSDLYFACKIVQPSDHIPMSYFH